MFLHTGCLIYIVFQLQFILCLIYSQLSFKNISTHLHVSGGRCFGEKIETSATQNLDEFSRFIYTELNKYDMPYDT